MIVKGKSRPAASGLGRYLMKRGENERVTFKEVRGLGASSLHEAMREMDAIGQASQAEKYIYHASINPAASEPLTPDQMMQAVDILERHLKLEGHARAIVAHEKAGREHYHIAWLRVDPETMKAVKMSHNYRAHEEAAREIERTFGLELTQGRHTGGGPEPERCPKQWEMDRGRRSGIDPRKMKAELSALWAEHTDGEAFRAALEARGYLLAIGEKRAFLVVDANGDPHSLARRVGAKAAEVKDHLQGIDLASLPDAERAREMQEERKAAHRGAGLFDRGDMVSQQQDANRHAADHQKAARKAFREAQAAAKATEGKQEEKTAEKATAQRQAAQEQDKQTKAAQQKKDREEQDKRAKAAQAQKPQSRGEQTDRKQQYSQRDIMQELFRKQFGLPKEKKEQERGNDWDRERER